LIKLNFSKNFLILAALFIAAAFISWPLYFNNYAAPDTVSVHEFPKTVGEWTSEELPISDEEYAILETRNAFTRMYTDAQGRQVMLYIIYAQHNRRVAHPPEICYSGGGATIISKYPYTIGTGEQKLSINRVLIDYARYQQIMYYWFKVGNSYTASYWGQQALIGVKTLLGRPSGSALIRLTTVITDNDEKKAARAIEDFTKEIIPLLPKYLL